MGVLVFLLAIVPLSKGNGEFFNLMKAESPGPSVGKIRPKISETAKITYLIYLALTVIECLLLVAEGLPLFDAVVTAYGTAGTGGFGIRADSLGSYSPYCQWVITAFMLLFGLNFNLYYLIIAGKIRSALRSEEMHVYLGIAVVSTTIIAINVARMYSTVGEVIRHSAFQMASILTTTGFSTVDFNQWPGLSKTILVVLMCIGGCAGSTAGGLKVSRVILIIKGIGSEIKHLLHPRSITRGTFEGKGITKELRSGVNSYFALYILVFAVTFIIVSFESFDFETNATAVIACMNNIGPGLAGVGPAAGYYDYSVVSKLVLSLAMLMGRLELYPIILAMASIGKRNIGSARLSQTKRAVRRS
jgi:trk system potassium uptake protein TrkH